MSNTGTRTKRLTRVPVVNYVYHIQPGHPIQGLTKVTNLESVQPGPGDSPGNRFTRPGIFGRLKKGNRGNGLRKNVVYKFETGMGYIKISKIQIGIGMKFKV